MNNCKTCHWHEPAKEPGRDATGSPCPVGFCHLNPPQIGPTGSAYPVVGSDTGWCGQYSSKSVARAKRKAA